MPITGLHQLLAPLEPRAFFQDYFNRRPLYIGGRAERYVGLFDRASFDGALPHCPVLKVGYTDPLGTPAERPITAAQVPAMLALGRTVCAGNIGQADPRLQAFLEQFAAEVVSMGQYYFNAYLSPAGHGFSLHFDDHPVWILQLFGRKKWRVSSNPARPRIAGGATLAANQTSAQLPWATLPRPADDQWLEFTLSPGDLLYLPAGFWHQAWAEGESLALTLAELCATPLDVVQRAVGQRIRFSTACRHPLPAAWRDDLDPQRPPEPLRADLELALIELRGLLDTLTIDDLYQVWRTARVEAVP